MVAVAAAAMLAVGVALTSAAPAPAPQAPTDVAAPVAPSSYSYKVEDAEKGLYHGKEESVVGGRVEGKYYVWLPDKRLMTVTYYVDGESGYVPTVTFQEDFNPPFGQSETPAAGKR